MTFGQPGDAVPHDGFRKMADRIAKLEAWVTQQSGKTVDRGDMVVYDGNGNALNVNQLAYGPVGANDGGASLQQNVLNTWQQGPMSLSVEVVTGRLLVFAGAQITTQTGVTELGFMSWDLAGPTHVPVSIGRAYVVVSDGTSATAAGFPYMHTGLAPGEYTITDWYRTQGALSGGGLGPIFASRTLVAFPF